MSRTPRATGVRQSTSATETSWSKKAGGCPFHRVKFLLSGHNVGQIYFFEAKKGVKRLQALAGTDTNYVVFALNFGD